MPNEKFYTLAAWRNLRAYKLQLTPLCERCNEIATEVHHIKERNSFPELELDISNLESLCKTCHSKHTRKQIKREWKPYKIKYG
jgi:5-methylcytosine-specific restriction protein A